MARDEPWWVTSPASEEIESTGIQAEIVDSEVSPHNSTWFARLLRVVTWAVLLKGTRGGALKRRILTLNKLKPRILRDNQATPGGPNRTGSSIRSIFSPLFFLLLFLFQGRRGTRSRRRAGKGWKRRVALSRLCSLSLSHLLLLFTVPLSQHARARDLAAPSPPFNQPLPYLCAGRHSSRKIFLRSSKRTTLS